MRDREQLRAALRDYPNVRAFLRAIRVGEGTSDDLGYHRLCGGEIIDDLSHHPRKLVPIPRYGIKSSAFGAYQINWPTFSDLATIWGFTDMQPDSQDEMAVALLIRCGALDHVVAGRLAEAVDAANETWASLPGSPYGQRTEKMARVEEEFVKWGGVIAA